MSDIPFLPVTTSNVDAWVRQAATTVNLLIAALDTTPSGGATTGEIKLWPVSTAPTGWLSCNGAAISRTTYATLYALIGTAFGAGDGSTTFNVPDMRGKFVRGVPNAGTIGATGGASTVTLTQANLPNVSFTVTDAGHSHSFTGIAHSHTLTDGGHSHPAVTGNFVLGADGSGAALGTLTASASAEEIGIDSITGMGPVTGSATTGITIGSATAGGTVGSAATGITVASGGSGTAITITPPYIDLHYIIKT